MLSVRVDTGGAVEPTELPNSGRDPTPGIRKCKCMLCETGVLWHTMAREIPQQRVSLVVSAKTFEAGPNLPKVVEEQGQLVIHGDSDSECEVIFDVQGCVDDSEFP